MIDAYLARLGVRPDGPTLDGLFALHRAQVERVPYENIDIYLGRPPGIGVAESLDRAGRGRGGYCYQLNGAFATLLAELGYDVTWHVGGVHQAAGPVGATGNHLALTVAGLPAPECPDGVWFVDAGLGDAVHEPLPLREGVYRQGPFTFSLEPSAVVAGGWHFTHTAEGSFAGMDFGPPAAGQEAFADMHQHLSTSPESGFTRTLTVQRRFASHAEILRGRAIMRHDASGRVGRVVDGPREWEAALAAFDLDLADVDLGALWAKVAADHEAWIGSLAATEVSS